jgi:hypothetical protein
MEKKRAAAIFSEESDKPSAGERPAVGWVTGRRGQPFAGPVVGSETRRLT